MIKAVLFDLGNVIVPVDFRRCHQALAQVCPHPPESVRKILGGTALPIRFEQGEISPEDFVAETCQLLGMNLRDDEFWSIWKQIFAPEPLIPESLLEQLHRQHRLLLLSNTNPVHFEAACERYPQMGLFDDYVLSYKVGAMKPDARIYQEAIARAGCLAEECLFIDDLAANVEAARQQRMDAVQFESLSKLRDDLRVRGLSR